MTIKPPVDATKTEAWKQLDEHLSQLKGEGINLRQWFADDAERTSKLSFEAGDLHFDLSKNLIKPETLKLFAKLADEVNLRERTEDMFNGVHINNTEDRAVLHTALRRPVNDEGELIVDGQDVVKDVRDVLERIYSFANKVRSGQWRGVTGKKIETVVNIGIGGSDLGPVMVYEALKPYADAGLSARFISNIDPQDMSEKTKDLDPETTLFVIVSKTFTTLETLTNARDCRAWLLDKLQEQGAIDGSEASRKEAVKKHFIAVSTNLKGVEEFGIDTANTFGFWNWVGGRYSVDSAVGTILAIVLGPERFEQFLQGFHTMDEYFRTTPYEKNVVALMGMMNVVRRLLRRRVPTRSCRTTSICTASGLPAAALTMESNGKSVRWDGTPVTSKTGEILGEPGTNGQHLVLPADPPGHAHHPGRLHRLRQHEGCRQGRRPGRAGALPVQLPGADQGARLRQDARRGARRGQHRPGGRRRPRVHWQPSDHLDLRRRADLVQPRRVVSLYEMIVFTEAPVWASTPSTMGVELGKKFIPADRLLGDLQG